MAWACSMARDHSRPYSEASDLTALAAPGSSRAQRHLRGTDVLAGHVDHGDVVGQACMPSRPLSSVTSCALVVAGQHNRRGAGPTDSGDALDMPSAVLPTCRSAGPGRIIGSQAYAVDFALARRFALQYLECRRSDRRRRPGRACRHPVSLIDQAGKIEPASSRATLTSSTGRCRKTACVYEITVLPETGGTPLVSVNHGDGIVVPQVEIAGRHDGQLTQVARAAPAGRGHVTWDAMSMMSSRAASLARRHPAHGRAPPDPWKAECRCRLSSASPTLPPGKQRPRHARCHR